jgi:hypothetical protein
MWPPEAQREYQELIDKAETVRVVLPGGLFGQVPQFVAAFGRF